MTELAMTLNVALHNRSSRMPRHRVGVALCLLMLGFVTAVTSPAMAQCTAPVTLSTPGVNHAYFKCYRWCVIARRDAPVLANLTLRGTDSLVECFWRCRDTPGCRTVTIQERAEIIDGVSVVVRQCILYGAGEMPVMSASEIARPTPGTYYYVCYPVPPPGRQPWHDATPPDKLQQDQIRPGAPRPRGK
jgi:hypothetical protein